MSAKRPKKPLPPPPGDIHNYIIVQSKEGPHWRRKRGTVKKGILNTALRTNAKLTAVASPAAKNILTKLDSFVQELELGRFIARVSGRLKKAWNKNGRFDYTFMEGYEMQPDRPMYELMPGHKSAHEDKNVVTVTIPLTPHRVKRMHDDITSYFFDVVLIYGDPSRPRQLRIENETSQVFHFDSNYDTPCYIDIILPSKKKSWMVLLKVSCMENNQMAQGSRFYGMKVIKVG